VQPFTTGYPLCPIESYEATLQSGITSSNLCPTPPDSSEACREIFIDTSESGTFNVSFTAKAKGDAELK